MATFNHLPHLAEEKRKEQCANVQAIDIGITQQHDLVISQLLKFELGAETSTDRLDQREDFGVIEHFVDTSPLDIEDLATNGQDRHVVGIASFFRRTTSRVALDDVQLTLFWFG